MHMPHALITFMNELLAAAMRIFSSSVRYFAFLW